MAGTNPEDINRFRRYSGIFLDLLLPLFGSATAVEAQLHVIQIIQKGVQT